MNRVLVVGDAMLDKYIHGDVSRISPEAPIPVLSIQQEMHRAGGASNVALNISALGIQCDLLTSVGHDADGDKLINLVERNGVKVHSVFSKRTITKTRYTSGSQQILRCDNDVQIMPSDVSEQAYSIMKILVSKQDFVVFSDYGKGLLGSIPELIKLCQINGVPTIVDPKGTDFTKYSGVDFISPNLKELNNFITPKFNAPDNENNRIKALRESGIKNIIVTKSEQGASLYKEGKTHHTKPESIEVYDVTGAGDIFVATFVKSLLEGETERESLRISCELATNSVKFLGPHVTTLTEYEAATSTTDPKPKPQVVFTNGCFDVFHLGHLRYLKHCKSLGDKLIVAINSDSSVKRLKGSSRPINKQDVRKAFLEELPFVDEVIIFEQDTPLQLIDTIKPNFLVKGGDYQLDSIVGAAEVVANGGEVVISPFVPGHSSSQILNKLEKS
jgi:D-beta-D-heptose 7-phosphate kinase/D-beta-D-heptose 1-phosphate adenosyltransferase